MNLRMAAIAWLLGCAVHAGIASATQPPALPGDSVYQFRATLVDASGQPLAWQDLRGRPRIATMFYASCRYVCPLVIDSLRSIERQLTPAERQRIGFVLITIDPERDGPEALSRAMSERRLTAAHWRLLQPKPADLRGIAGMLGVRYRSMADGEFNHTTTFVLIDDQGRVLARSERLGADTDPEFMAAVRAAAAGGARGR